MKQYVFDELRPHDHDKLKAYLDEKFTGEEIKGIYWIPLEKELLSEMQIGHPDCQPHYLVAELSCTSFSVELLIRTRQKVKCSCMEYATVSQRNWIFEYFDTLLENLGIRI